MLTRHVVPRFRYFGIFATILLLTACSLSVATEVTGGVLTSAPTSQAPILGITEETQCYYGPGSDYQQVTMLDSGQYFGIIGIDDDVSWIDDDVTWFQIDPTAIIDPDPPGRPLDESSGSEITTRCWVPGDHVETSGDLTQLPVIQVPVLGVSEATGCYALPDTAYEEMGSLDIGQWFRILAIDDDVSWIDDDVTWFQIDPTAIIDPDPPHRPLNELSPQPDPPGSAMILLCWVPGDHVETSGDISMLPIGFRHPGLRLLADANCRSGPGMDYPALDILPQGLSVPINGRNQDSSWWQLASPNLNLNCWLSGKVIELSGDTGDVPVVQVAPPPVAVPSDTPVPLVNCAQFNGQTCEANNHPCKWTGNVCINK